MSEQDAASEARDLRAAGTSTGTAPSILEFRPRRKTPPIIGPGISALYFHMPAARQARRRQELVLAGFPADLIRALCRAGGRR